MHGCPSCLGPYLKVECMNQSETNFSRTAHSQRFWQGAICQVWTSQLDKHWQHSQKETLAYKLVDRLEVSSFDCPREPYHYSLIWKSLLKSRQKIAPKASLKISQSALE